jgi:hypothetical protein
LGEDFFNHGIQARGYFFEGQIGQHVLPRLIGFQLSVIGFQFSASSGQRAVRNRNRFAFFIPRNKAFFV